MIKKMKKSLLAISLLFIVSCMNKEYKEIKTTLAIDAKNHPVEFTKIKEELRRRIEDNGFMSVELEDAKKENQIIVKSLIEEEERRTYNSLFKANRFDLWNTFRTSDEEISSIDPEKLKTPGFKSYIEIGKGYTTLEVLGICIDETKKAEIIKSLQDSLKDIPQLKLIWSQGKSKNYNFQFYQLYMIDTDGNKNAPMTESDIIKSGVERDSYHPSNYFISVKFSESGTKTWADITQKAAYDGNRCIALVLNERLVSCPSVREPIISGNASISSDYTEEEATDIARGLRLNRLSYDLQIVDQELIDEIDKRITE